MRKLIFLFTFLLLLELAVATTKYGATWEETCSDNICTRTLYSGVRYVYEEGQWKKIEEAKSLKQAWKINFLEIDPDFTLSDFAYNYSYFGMNMSFNGSWQDYPTFCTEKPNSDVTCTFKLEEKTQEWDNATKDFVETELEYEYEWEYENGLVTSDKLEFKMTGDHFGKRFKFGGNSTIFTLQDNETENLGDTNVRQRNPDTTYGTNTFLRFGEDVANEDIFMLIRFNISSLNSSNITYANLSLYLYDDTFLPSEYILLELFDHPNLTWSDETTTWDNFPNVKGSSVGNFTLNHTIGAGWLSFNVTDVTKANYFNGSLSFYFDYDLESGVSAWADFYSREFSNASLRPKLEVEYIKVAPEARNVTISPTPAESTDNLNCVYDYYDINNDAETGQEYVWYNDSINISTQMTLGSGNTTTDGQIICGVRVRDIDAWGNWTNSSLLVIGDMQPPTLTNFSLPTSATQSQTYNLDFDCVDVSSNIQTTTSGLIDPDNQWSEITYSLNSGNTYRYLFTPGAVGTYYVSNFTCTDSSNNTVSNTTMHTISVSAAQLLSGGGRRVTPYTSCNWKIFRPANLVWTAFGWEGYRTNPLNLQVYNNQSQTILFSFSSEDIDCGFKQNSFEVQGNSFGLNEIVCTFPPRDQEYIGKIVVEGAGCTQAVNTKLVSNYLGYVGLLLSGGVGFQQSFIFYGAILFVIGLFVLKVVR